MGAVVSTSVVTLFASAVAGRPVAVLEASAGESYLEGLTLYMAPGLTLDQQLITAALHCALIGAGSLQPVALRALRGRASACRRWLLVEGCRAVRILNTLIPPGTAQAIAAFNLPRVETAQQALDFALGHQPVPPVPQWLGTLRPQSLAVHADALTTSRQPGNAAPQPESDNANHVAALRSQLQALLALLAPRDNAVLRLLRELFGGKSFSRLPADAQTGANGDGISDGQWAAHVAPDLPRVSAPLHPLNAKPLRGPTVATWPEWDGARRRYRPQWCSVVAFAANEGEPHIHRDLAARRAIGFLHRDLRRTRHQPQGADIDYDAALRAAIDLRGGHTPDERIAVDLLRRARDLGVLILLDISGSVLERGTGQRPVHAHQLDAAAALLDAFDVHGDRIAVQAFHSRGRGHIHFRTIKNFNESNRPATARRLGGIEPGAFTRIGAAVRHGGWMLREQAGTQRKLMIVISDGFAYDEGYEGSYAEADATQALQEVRASGIGAACLTLGTAMTDAALTRVFGAACHAAAPDWPSMRALIRPLLSDALALSESH